GDRNIVRKNLVRDITVTGNPDTVGIGTSGIGTLVQGNVIGNIKPPSCFNVYGIKAVGSFNRIVDNDVDYAPSIGSNCDGTGISLSHGFATGNRISYAIHGIEMGQDAKFRDNLTLYVAVPYSGGTDAGNNN